MTRALTRMNNLTPDEVAHAMEQLPTDVLEWAVEFEALAQSDPAEEEA